VANSSWYHIAEFGLEAAYEDLRLMGSIEASLQELMDRHSVDTSGRGLDHYKWSVFEFRDNANVG
jgi:hypothetical protein